MKLKFGQKGVEKVNLDDEWGRASKGVLEVRSLLWQMVEHVAKEERKRETPATAPAPASEPEQQSLHIYFEEPLSIEGLEGLPLSFGARPATKKRKRAQSTEQITTSKDPSRGPSAVKLPKYNPRKQHLIEHNVAYHNATEEWMRILGVGPHSSAGKETMLVQVLASEEEDAPSRTRKEISRRDPEIVLIAGNSEWEAMGYEYSERDLWQSFYADKPEDVHEKYWDQRYRIFSRFDRGALLDAESWYSITYENIAAHVAQRCKRFFDERGAEMKTVLDCFSGCGGCTIPFAALGARVVAVDIDEKKLKYLKHNCSIYDVTSNVEVVQRDVWDVLSIMGNPHRWVRLRENVNKTFRPYEWKKYDHVILPVLETESMSEEELAALRRPSGRADVVVLSPPWGGPEYLEVSEYDLSTMLTCGDGLDLVAAAGTVSDTIVYIVPRNTSDKQLRMLSSVMGCAYFIENIFVSNKCKVKVAYYFPKK